MVSFEDKIIIVIKTLL